MKSLPQHPAPFQERSHCNSRSLSRNLYLLVVVLCGVGMRHPLSQAVERQFDFATWFPLSPSIVQRQEKGEKETRRMDGCGGRIRFAVALMLVAITQTPTIECEESFHVRESHAMMPGCSPPAIWEGNRSNKSKVRWVRSPIGAMRLTTGNADSLNHSNTRTQLACSIPASFSKSHVLMTKKTTNVHWKSAQCNPSHSRTEQASSLVARWSTTLFAVNPAQVLTSRPGPRPTKQGLLAGTC